MVTAAAGGKPCKQLTPLNNSRAKGIPDLPHFQPEEGKKTTVTDPMIYCGRAMRSINEASEGLHTHQHALRQVFSSLVVLCRSEGFKGFDAAREVNLPRA